MRSRQSVVYFAPEDRPVPELVSALAVDYGLPLLRPRTRADVEMIAARSLPAVIVVAAELDSEGRALCASLKLDPYTGVIPVAVIAPGHQSEETRAWFEIGADEVITPIFDPPEQRARLDALLARAQTAVAVHPSTRLAGTTDIEREIKRRLESGEPFAVCYADLDHFKE
ncbi:MAG: hypothetical protein OEW56_14260, partial [Gemmatimonadota bacterium]|nr:hypothetical protein [Gemmatimonadota bacterium]